MKKLLSLASAVIFIISTSFAQEEYTETRDVTGFTEVSLAVAGELYITIGQGYKVVLEGDRDYISEIETKVSGDELVIKRDKWFDNGNRRVTVRVTMPALEGVDVSGSGKVTVNDPVKADNFEINISGSGRIQLGMVTITDLECGISGSGSLVTEGEGTVGKMEIDISGSGSYKGPNTKLGTLEASISGSGSCDCYVTDILKAAISGSGHIYYSGNPKIDAAISGSGRVKMK